MALRQDFFEINSIKDPV